MVEEGSLEAPVLDDQGKPVVVKATDALKGRLVFWKRVGDEYHAFTRVAGNRLSDSERKRRAEERKKANDRMKDQAKSLRKRVREARAKVRKNPYVPSYATEARDAVLAYERFMADWKGDQNRLKNAMRELGA
jgi:hypothetical protein